MLNQLKVPWIEHKRSNIDIYVELCQVKQCRYHGNHELSNFECIITNEIV